MSKMITFKGKLPKIAPSDARRLTVYIVRGAEILAQERVQEDGSFRINLSRHLISETSVYGLQAVVGPAGMSGRIEHLKDLQTVPLDQKHLEKAEREFEISTKNIKLNDEILERWWLWCEWYCVSGNVIGPDGCPVPGAQVTVYSVGFNFLWFTKTAQVTVNADQNGRFTACFPWCGGFCWPCWPIWWDCWPWWWELDILNVIEAVEQFSPVGPGPVEGIQNGLNLIRPAAKDLVRGQGFAGVRKLEARFAPDAARTALIKRKLSNARIREIFPWWWWCCDDPSIVFTVTQGANTIVDENPATETRWCFEEGSTVTLVGNQQTISHCEGDPPPLSGFAWTRVGNITVDKIHQGYADGPGGDTSDLAFAGSLDIYGGFALGSGVAYYQVDAGLWSGLNNGNPARGGTAPGSSSPISADLYNYVYIFDGSANLTFSGPVKMGPFSQGGLTNLYSTQEARQTAPTGTGLDPFPAVPPGGFVLWAYEGLKVSTAASSLIGGATVGAVDLTVTGFDTGFASVTLTPDDPLTLEVDAVPLTTAHVNNVTAYHHDGTLAHLTLGGTGDCPAYDIGPGGYVTIDVTISDANGELWEYEVDAEYGHGHITTVTPPGTRGYSQSPMSFPPGPYQAPDTAHKSFGGGQEVMTYAPPVDCCYLFQIRAGKRVTDGYNYPTLADYDFQTVSLKVSS
jgi:hypothetical protein